MSHAKARRVRKAAKKASTEAKSDTVICCEKAQTSARKATMVATGWMARPRVQLEPIVTTPPLLGASTCTL